MIEKSDKPDGRYPSIANLFLWEKQCEIIDIVNTLEWKIEAIRNKNSQETGSSTSKLIGEEPRPDTFNCKNHLCQCVNDMLKVHNDLIREQTLDEVKDRLEGFDCREFPIIKIIAEMREAKK